MYYPPITIDNTRMGDGGFFRGTSANQDARFLDKQKKLKAQMKFDPVLETKVIHFLHNRWDIFIVIVTQPTYNLYN